MERPVRSLEGGMMSKRAIGRGILDALSGLPLFVTAPLFRRWHLRWGATDEEVRGSMPGDEIVPKASFNATRAITINGPPEAVCILEEYQTPKIGDWMPMYKKVNETTAFKVKAFDTNRWLLWGKPDSTWSWKLISLKGGRTRLISRLKQRYAWEAPVSAILTLLLLEFGDFPMMRQVLTRIKARAERRREEQETHWATSHRLRP
jgi:hypothetical protein